MNTKMVILKQTIGNHLKFGGLLIGFILFFLSAMFYIPEKSWNENIGVFPFFVMLLLPSITVLPGIYLHLEYTVVNWRQKIVVEEDQLTIFALRSKRTVMLKDITAICLYKSRNADSFALFPMSRYSFVKLMTRSGESVVVTCLVCRDLERYFPRRQNTEYCWIKPFFNSIVASRRCLP